MAFFTLSPNMSLPVPTVGVDPGPDWANNINSSLTLLDQHNHAPGSGVQINPAGLNINSDLAFNNNNLTLARSIRFQSQSAALAGGTDVGCLYEVAADLYYNDGSGNQIRLTQSGSIAGTSGSIANLTSPASATYVSGSSTFVWQSAANTPANMDAGSFVFRNVTANSKGLTVSAPAALSADYSIVWPSLPGVSSFLAIDASGNMSATVPVSQGITRANLAAVGQQISSSSGSVTTTRATYVDITNLSVTITTTGRPVVISLIPDGSANTSGIICIRISGTTTPIEADFKLVRGATDVCEFGLAYGAGSNTDRIQVPPAALFMIDTPSSGTYVYKYQYKSNNSGVRAQSFYCRMIAYEL